MLKNHFLYFTLGQMTVMRIKKYKKEVILKFNFVLWIVAPLLLFYLQRDTKW